MKATSQDNFQRLLKDKIKDNQKQDKSITLIPGNYPIIRAASPEP
jgi:hypothetical protein